MRKIVALSLAFASMVMLSEEKKDFSLTAHAIPRISNLLRTKSADEVEEAFKSAMELFKEIMKTGDAEFGIPILDPLVIQENIDIDNDKITLKGQFYAEISNLSNFVIEHFHADMDLNVAINASLNDVFMTGHYNLDGRAYGVVPLVGRGNHYLNFTTLNLSIKPKLIAAKGYLKLVDTGLAFHTKDFQIFIEGLLEEQDIADVLAYSTRDLVASLIGRSDQLCRLINNHVVESFNVDGKGKNIFDLIETIKDLAE